MAAGLVAVDSVLFDLSWTILRRFGMAAAAFAAPMVIYYFWNVRFVGMLVAKTA